MDAVELDVRKTKDNLLVVIHDADVKRTTNKEGLVHELTLKEIKSLSTEGNEKIPTWRKRWIFWIRRVKVLIELKEAGVEAQVLAIVRQERLEKNVVITSFLEDALQNFRELDDRNSRQA